MLHDLLTPESVVPNLRAAGKKQALQDLSSRAAARAGLSPQVVLDVLLQRENLGSTGVGQGVAIPHARIAGLDVLMGYFARLERPIDFEALDDEPVDLVFLLLAPEGAGADHLKALARIARLFRLPRMTARLRATTDPEALYALLTQAAESNAA